MRVMVIRLFTTSSLVEGRTRRGYGPADARSSSDEANRVILEDDLYEIVQVSPEPISAARSPWPRLSAAVASWPAISSS